MSEELLKYRCPVCGEVNYAHPACALVTCDQGHHLSIGSLPDDDGFVTAEELEDID